MKKIVAQAMSVVLMLGLLYGFNINENNKGYRAYAAEEPTANPITTFDVLEDESTSEGETTVESSSPEEPTSEEPTSEEPTTEEPTTVDYEIIDEVYKVRNDGTLLEYLGDIEDTTITKLTIPKQVKVISDSVFKYAHYITKVTFEEESRLTTIGKQAFYQCDKLTSITLPSTVTSIGKQAFYKCEALKKITIPSGVKTIYAHTFSGCKSLTKVTLPSELKTIGEKAFYNCKELLTLTIKKTVTSIGVDAFGGADKLKLLVYANSYGKTYARKNNIPWEFTKSEQERQANSIKIRDNFIAKASPLKYKLSNLKKYIPQGTCVIDKYVITSMYAKGLGANSILLVYNKKTGKFLKQVVLPSRDHVGSITNVKGRLVVGLNNISQTDYVAVINLNRLKKIKNGKTIKYNYVKKIEGYADFATFDGKVFWAGRSANVSYATMYGYKVSVKKKKLVFKKKHSFVVPANSQGLIAKRSGSVRTFIFASSYGRLSDSSIIKYKVNINKSYVLGTPVWTKYMPSMLEGMAVSGQYVYSVFESAAGYYCSNPDNTSEIQMDHIYRIKYTELDKL